MNCPICNSVIIENKNEYYEDRPSYRCYASPLGELMHYQKYFENDWSYSRYREIAQIGEYRISNFYDYRNCNSDIGMIQKYVRQPDIAGVPHFKYATLLQIDRVFPIPSQEQFMDKIKLYLLYS